MNDLTITFNVVPQTATEALYEWTKLVEEKRKEEQEQLTDVKLKHKLFFDVLELILRDFGHKISCYLLDSRHNKIEYHFMLKRGAKERVLSLLHSRFCFLIPHTNAEENAVEAELEAIFKKHKVSNWFLSPNTPKIFETKDVIYTKHYNRRIKYEEF